MESCYHISDFPFLSLYIHVTNDRISKQIQCVCDSRELYLILALLIQDNYHSLEVEREGVGEREEQEGGGTKEKREERGEKKGIVGERREKNVKRGSKSNIDLKLSNFRYHRNCYRNFTNKLQINAAKNTYNQTSSDKAPFNYILHIILKEENKIWNTKKLLDVYRNKGGS